MKKLIFSAAVLASAFFAASCQQEMLDPQAEGTTVTYTVEVPDAIATKATGDGFTLHYEVYRQDYMNETAPVYKGTKEFSGGKATVELEFVKDQEFYVLFWAQQTTGAQAYNITDLRKVSLNTLVANDLTAEVFAGNDHVSDCKSDKDGNVVLVRPVAQLNIATTAESFTLGTTGSTEATVVPTQSKVVVNGLYGTYNVADGTVGTKASRTYTEDNVPGSDFKSTYKLMATNYLGFIPQAGDNVEVTFTIYTENDGNIEHTVSNVPVKANYQTNILGNLISATADYQVTLEDWADAGKDMEVLADGIVKNINGDYEISTAVGFAYAINKLFADGGTFYIHPGSYNFTGLVVVPQPTKPGAILNVKANEVPVVTRSTPGFEIIGLDVAYLVSEVTNGSQAIFSNLVLPEDTKLVGTNNGVVGVSGCSNEDTDVPAELIGVNGQNGKVVNTVSMASVDEIKAAMEQDLKLIELTGDITGLTEIFTISKSVTIDGCGHKLTSSAGRAINVSGADGVTIKNLVIECTGERAINIIQNATNVTIDNVTATASNYTVNVATSAPGAVVNIKNSTLNGLCTVNVASPSAVVTVDNSTINCNDNNTTVGESYAALCLNKDAVGGKIEVTNSTINVVEGSDSRKAKNGAEDGIITIDGSAEEVSVQVAAITFEDAYAYYSFTSLEDAIAYAQEYNRPVTLIRNITVAEPVIIEEGQTVVLDLNGKTITGTMPKSVGHVLKNEGTLTLKNGTISSTGANGGSAIYNAGTLTVQNATINGASVRENEGWPSYPVNNYSDATLENVTVTGYQGAIAANAPGTTTVTNCTINKEYLNTSSHVFYINHADAKVVVDGGTYTHKGMDGSLAYVIKGRITVNGGTFSASNGGYGMASLTEGSVEVNGGDFTASFLGWGGTINIMGGTFASKPADAHLADGYKAVQNAETGKWEVVAKTYVAQIGDEKYESLQDAVDAVKTGDTITILKDLTDVASYYNGTASFTLDLNGKTLTSSDHTHMFEFNWNQVAESTPVTINITNGTLISGQNTRWTIYSEDTNNVKGTFNLTNLTIDHNMPNYGAVVAGIGNTFNAENVNITTSYGIGFYAAGGEVVMNDCSAAVEGLHVKPYNSMAFAVVGNGKMTIESGIYSATPVAESDANNQGTSHGSWCGGIMNSGGTLIINGGTFSNDNFGDNNLATAARGLLLADTGANIEINGGTFNAVKSIIDIQNNLGDASKNPTVLLAGGNYSSNPLTWDGLISAVEGKGVVEGADGRWTIQ